MEPLFDKDSNRSRDKCNEKTQHPNSIDDGVNSGLLEGRSGEIWDCRIDEVPIDRHTGNLRRKLHEDLICEILGLLLKILVRFDDERSDDG